MQIHTITWTYRGLPDCLWHGRCKGLYTHIHFVIAHHGKDYFLSTDYKNINNKTCGSAFLAKETAQKLLDSYAFTLSI